MSERSRENPGFFRTLTSREVRKGIVYLSLLASAGGTLGMINNQRLLHNANRQLQEAQAHSNTEEIALLEDQIDRRQETQEFCFKLSVAGLTSTLVVGATLLPNPRSHNGEALRPPAPHDGQ